MSSGGQRQRAGGSSDGTGAASCHAFTLIELLIVLALILVLVAVTYSSSSGSRQTRMKAACQRNLQTLHVALELYANDFSARFPLVNRAATAEEPLRLLVPAYTATTEPFICPGSRDPRLPEGEAFERRRISYAYYTGRLKTDPAAVLLTDRQVNTNSKTRGEAVFSPDGKAPGNNHHRYGGNLLFCDGHVESIPAQAPRDLPLAQGITLLNPKPAPRR